MTITTIESVLRKIAAQEIGINANDVVDDLHAPFQRNVLPINERTCVELDLDIKTAEAKACRTFGEYVALVQSRRSE